MQGAIGQRCGSDAFFIVSLQDMVPIIVDYCLLLQRKWVYIACQIQLFWILLASRFIIIYCYEFDRMVF